MTSSTLHDAQWDAVEEAVECLREGDRDAALRELETVLASDPGNPYAHFFTAAVHYEREDFDAARGAYERALEYAPGYLGAWVGLGHTLRNLGRLDDALRAGQKALSLGDPDDPDAHFLLGVTYAGRNDPERAIPHIQVFIASHPEAEALYEAEALLQTLQGKARPLEPTE